MLAAGALIASHSIGVQAAVLWDQQPDANARAFVDQDFTDFPDFSTFLVSDVVFSSNVTVNSVTTYFTNLNSTWPQSGNGTAILNIFADPLASADDPTAGTSVTAAYSVDATGISLTASGLSIDLAAGTYWIGLTPILIFGDVGQEFHQQAASTVGANTQGRNPGGGFGFGTDWFDAGPAFGGLNEWDAAITIEGESVPAPATLVLLGLGLAGIGYQRRKHIKAP